MSKKSKTIRVQGTDITIPSEKEQDYISLTDMLKAKDGDFFISDWLRNRNTVEYLGIWERIHNPEFNYGEFATIKFGMWISAEFKIYLIKEFQRLKDEEQKQLGWDIRRNLTKINFRIHTDAIKTRLIPESLTKNQINQLYASEADVLNMALFGKTAAQWRHENPHEKGNIRDFANVSQLVCLANLENLNAVFIHDGLPQFERLSRLNTIAIQQMKILLDDKTTRRLEENVDDLKDRDGV